MSKNGRMLQTPRIQLLCDTGAQVDCISKKKLNLLGLEENQLRKPGVVLDCANKTEAGVLGVFFGEVSPMEGDWKVDKVKVLFYVMKQGGDMLSRHTCERLGLVNKEFPKPGFVEKVDGVEHAEVHGVDGGVYQEYGECDPDQGGIKHFTSWEPMLSGKNFARNSGSQMRQKTWKIAVIRH